MKTVLELGKAVKQASRQATVLTQVQKNAALSAMAEALLQKKQFILSANAEDLREGKNTGLSESLLDRLALSESRIEDMSASILQIAALEDPIGKVDRGFVTANGLQVYKVRVPLGVCGIIYEARPNVTVDAAVLCFKSGNAVLLRGGKEAISSNICLVSILRDVLEKQGLDPNLICLVEDTSRESAAQMMKLNGYLDVLIPRGGAGLIRSVVENATVPVIETGTGNCHVYIDKDADLTKGVEILFNAKTSRPSVCNAAESLLVHREIAEKFLPLAKQKLDTKGVVWYGCEETRRILGESVLPAGDEEYAKEFLDYAISCRVVDSLEDAADHIYKYSTRHSEAIVTENYTTAQEFIRLVDAAAVYVNASTRFTDGGVFGFGAEIGISTQKLHARGPMGLEELTSVKYVIYGNGQVR
ncbi:MAG TPA: glutamate-5-semialdehyde dehydrogenase [Oscillospiraceae bacterium]|nr:glutamate-5-semialdehyde dehydrogenase [Oscillospiraceae bacterium]